MADKVIQHMEAVLSEAGLEVNTKKSAVWTASGEASTTLTARRIWEQAGRHDGFVLLGTIGAVRGGKRRRRQSHPDRLRVIRGGIPGTQAATRKGF